MLDVLCLLAGCIDRQREEEEINDPLTFVTLKQSNPDPSFGKIEGYIVNHAEYTAYGNFNLLITYYSVRGQKIGSEYKAFFDVIPPGSRGHYVINLTPPPPPQVRTKEITVVISAAFPWMK